MQSSLPALTTPVWTPCARCVSSRSGHRRSRLSCASMIANKFSVITTLSRSVPGLENNLMRYGLAQKCARVRATEIPVLKLEEGDPATLDKIRQKSVSQ